MDFFYMVFLKIYQGLNYGGALILCEKVYQDYGKVQEIMTFSHYDYKVKKFTADEIIEILTKSEDEE